MVLTDGQQIRFEIIGAIQKAKKNLHLAVAFFTDLGIAEALVNARERGVDVKIITSDSSINKKLLDNYGSKLSIHVFESSLMHQKYLVIDSHQVIHGSYNYTNAAHKKNKEIVTISMDGKKFLKEFNQLYMESNESKTSINYDDISNPVQFNDSLDNVLSGILRSNLVQFDVQEIEDEGGKDAKQANGSKEIFITRINQYFQDFRQSISTNSAKIEQIKAQLVAAGDQVKEKVLLKRDEEINEIHLRSQSDLESINYDVSLLKGKQSENSNAKDKIQSKIDELSLLHSQANEEIESTKAQIGIVPFWRMNTTIKVIVTILLAGILSVFFASTFFNILVAEEIALERLGEDNPFVAQPIYFNIISLLQGRFGIAGLFAFLIFIVPVSFTLIKVIKPDVHWFGEFIFGWVIGVFMIDMFVAIRVANIQHKTYYIIDPSIGAFDPISALINGEIIIVFILGALPLMLVKMIGESVNGALLASSPYSIDKYKAVRLSSLKKELNKLNNKIKPLEGEINRLDKAIDEISVDIGVLQEKYKTSKQVREQSISDVKLVYEEKLNKVEESVSRYVTMLITGDKTMLKQGLEGKIATYKTGYFQWITSYFSEVISRDKIGSVEMALIEWYDINMN
jgi:predicted nuclease with TOPRIM domain